MVIVVQYVWRSTDTIVKSLSVLIVLCNCWPLGGLVAVENRLCSLDLNSFTEASEIFPILAANGHYIS